MVHGLGNGKYLAMSMVTTVVFVSLSTYFSVGINGIFFEKVIYRVAFDSSLEIGRKVSICGAINQKKKSTFCMGACGLSRDNFRGGRGTLSEFSTAGRKRFLARCLPFADFAFADSEVMRRLDGIIFEGRVSASCNKK
jgi:hypothetical protein